jgi:hypothetical protein
MELLKQAPLSVAAMRQICPTPPHAHPAVFDKCLYSRAFRLLAQILIA